MDNLLSSHIVDRLRNGASQTDIKKDLLAVGWTEDQVGVAIAEGLVATGVPAPQGKTVGSSRSSVAEVAVNFFSFVLLGIIAGSLITLYYAIINYYFPDALIDSSYYYKYERFAQTIHYAIAALIVAYPIYYFALRIWFKRFRENEKKVESGLTKWFTYIVLLIASGSVVGDLITVLFYFFQGEVTARFILKALVILFIGGTVFGFYYLERKKIQYGRDIARKTFNLFGIIVTVVIVIGIILGFLVAGSPATARKQGFDTQRSQDLHQISSSIDFYAYKFKRLPASLGELSTSGYSVRSSMNDPETGAQYEYRIVAVPTPTIQEGKYELCATFSLATDNTSTEELNYDNALNQYEEHPAGHKCFKGSVSTQTR